MEEQKPQAQAPQSQPPPAPAPEKTISAEVPAQDVSPTISTADPNHLWYMKALLFGICFSSACLIGSVLFFPKNEVLSTTFLGLLTSCSGSFFTKMKSV